jgi:hypothetical protein
MFQEDHPNFADIETQAQGPLSNLYFVKIDNDFINSLNDFP